MRGEKLGQPRPNSVAGEREGNNHQSHAYRLNATN
jgi:hypothetical protein